MRSQNCARPRPLEPQKAQNDTGLFPIYINDRTCIPDQWVTLLQRVDSETQCNSIWRQVAHLLQQASRRGKSRESYMEVRLGSSTYHFPIFH